jgi:glutamate/tyrosine decarboxylase-like PLP-dependent enzyme
MRALGHRVVDLLVDHWTALGDQPAGAVADRATLEARLREPAPVAGRDPEAVLARLERDVFSAMGRVHHPRFFAFVPSPSNFVSVLGDTLAAGYNVFAGTWFESSGPAMLELVVLDWLREWCGLPESTGGLFTSGGSAANLTALAVARRERLDDRVEGAVAYASDQAHSAVERALRVLGFAPEQLRTIPSDDRYRLPVEPLRAAIAADRAAGRRPFCVIASAGTTSTGAVDPLDALADLCEAEGLWLHADAAYGGAAVLCERGRAALAGIGRVDSLALDPHKWLFQPYETGCLMVRDPAELEAAFHVLPEYLQDTALGREQVNFGDRGLQLSRAFRALKVWMALQVHGRAAHASAIADGIALARRAGSWIEGADELELLSPPSLGVVCFRVRPPAGGWTEPELEELNRGVQDHVVAEGTAMMSSTRLRGRYALRLCILNYRTAWSDVEATLARIVEVAGEVAGRT